MKYVIATVAAVLVLVAGIAAWETREAYLLATGEEQGYERAMSELTERELAAERRGREEERKLTLQVQRKADEATLELTAARAALDDAERAGRRLREQLATAFSLNCAAAAQPAVAGTSPPTNPAADLLADVQRRLAEAEDRTIEFADAAHIAGKTCERIAEMKQ